MVIHRCSTLSRTIFAEPCWHVVLWWSTSNIHVFVAQQKTARSKHCTRAFSSGTGRLAFWRRQVVNKESWICKNSLLELDNSSIVEPKILKPPITSSEFSNSVMLIQSHLCIYLMVDWAAVQQWTVWWWCGKWCWSCPMAFCWVSVSVLALMNKFFSKFFSALQMRCG